MDVTLSDAAAAAAGIDKPDSSISESWVHIEPLNDARRSPTDRSNQLDHHVISTTDMNFVVQNHPRQQTKTEISSLISEQPSTPFQNSKAVNEIFTGTAHTHTPTNLMYGRGPCTTYHSVKSPELSHSDGDSAVDARLEQDTLHDIVHFEGEPIQKTIPVLLKLETSLAQVSSWSQGRGSEVVSQCSITNIVSVLGTDWFRDGFDMVVRWAYLKGAASRLLRIAERRLSVDIHNLHVGLDTLAMQSRPIQKGHGHLHGHLTVSTNFDTQISRKRTWSTVQPLFNIRLRRPKLRKTTVMESIEEEDVVISLLQWDASLGIAVSVSIPATSGSASRLCPTLRTHNIIPADAKIFDLIEQDDIEGVQDILVLGEIHPSDVDPTGNSLLACAVANLRSEIFQLLIEQGADLEHCYWDTSSDILRRVWLHTKDYTSGMRSYHSVAQLPEYARQGANIHQLVVGVDSDIADGNEKPDKSDAPNPLFHEGHLRSLPDPSSLLAYLNAVGDMHFDLEARNQMGQTPLLYAACSSLYYSVICLQKIISWDVDVHAVDRFCRGALHSTLYQEVLYRQLGRIPRSTISLEGEVCECGQIFEYPEAQSEALGSSFTKQGYARILCSDHRHRGLLQPKLLALLQAGCDPNIFDYEGLSPSDYARRGRVWSQWKSALYESGWIYVKALNRCVLKSDYDETQGVVGGQHEDEDQEDEESSHGGSEDEEVEYEESEYDDDPELDFDDEDLWTHEEEYSEQN